LGTISGIKAVYPTKRLGLFGLMHADLHSPYVTIGKYSWDALVSGSGRDNFDCQVNEITRIQHNTGKTLKHWYWIKIRPKI
jgi:arginase